MTTSCRHLISTVAPAASSSFLNFAVSSLFTPSLTVAGADSTRSLASFRPRPVIARTALMTSTFFSPVAFRTTVNSVFSSAGAAAAPPAAGPVATATGAAADTPNFSSIIFTRSVTSIRLMLPMAFRISSFETAIFVYLYKSLKKGADSGCGSGSACRGLLVAYRGHRARRLGGGFGQRAHQLGDRRQHDAHQHCQGLFAGRQRRELLDVCSNDQATT